ncbi:GCN5 family acetyltransferase [Opitutaceae bacterium TAV5]|nr:GCN5 family acetyltransferase [Opitutaceae bacterium TAV5]
MKIRRATYEDLPDLLRLYGFLQSDDPVPDFRDAAVHRHWEAILRDPRLLYFVAEAEGKVASTCTLTLIPNLNRAMRPYGLIENVVTDPDFRQQGLATGVLHAALAQAWREGCYKVMLLTGSKKAETLRFYEKAGFLRGIKTGFIAYPE